MQKFLQVAGCILAVVGISAGSIFLLRRQSPVKPVRAAPLPEQHGVPAKAPLKANRSPQLAAAAGQPEFAPKEESNATLPTPTPAAVADTSEPRPIAAVPAKVEKKEPATRPDAARQNTAKIQPDEPPAAPPLVSEPDARQALKLVGMDDEAEALWTVAINDANLSKKARQNLIEDLNEDGLSDPKHPSVEDLPLIMNRIELIEELAPDAMDEVNFNAFAEAYKDLSDMFNKLANQ